MQAAPELLQFAEVCLGSQYAEFKQALNDFPNMNASEFGKKYLIFERLCGDLEDIDEDEDEDFTPVLFILFAQDKKLMFSVDWSGEEETGDVAEAVKRILNVRSGTAFEWDTEKFMASLDWNSIERGDFIPILFKALDAELRKINHCLTIFCTGDDSYHFTVFDKADFDKVHRLAWSSIYGVYGVDTLSEYNPMTDYPEDEDDEE